MRTILVGILVAVSGSACVKGNPVDTGDGTLTDTGGTLAIAECGYSVTTRLGAEPPRVAVPTFGTDPTVRLVHLGIMGDPRSSVVVQWRTKDETTRATTIRFAQGDKLASAELTEQRTGIEFGYISAGTVYRMHQAHLCGLVPGTKYSYQVGGVKDGVEYFSPVYTFRTAPDLTAQPDVEVALAFVGDSRGGYDVWQQLVAQIAQRMPDLVLFSGDAVTFGISQFEWEDFFARAEPLFATVPVIAANGNHEGNAINYYAQMAMPGDQQNYGLDYGHAHITVGNDTPEEAGALTGAFRAALAADFEASKNARWKLFMHHQPMFSASTRHGPSETLQAAWLPLVDQYHLDLVLNGHDHDYEITHPLIGGVQSTSSDATVFVVAGGAGAELYPNGKQAWTRYSESSYTAAIIHVSKQTLSMVPFHHDGTALSDPLASFSKSK
jgi:acid phosphatase type 7